MTLSNFVNQYLANPLGVVWPDLILILLLAMSFIFFALGLRLGLILLWALLGVGYMVYYGLGIDTFHILTLFIVVGVIMVVSMFISHSHEKSGVVGI